jgi:hypothetical protein
LSQSGQHDGRAGLVRARNSPHIARLAGLPTKVLEVNFRHGIAAAALLSTTVFAVACAAPTAGTPSAGGPLAATSASTSAVSASSAVSTSSPAPSSSASPTSSSSAEAGPTSSASIEDSSVADPATVTLVIQPAGLDATTAIWLQNSCTDVDTLFGVLFAIPTVDETASLEEFRAAYRDYYASLADTLLGMTDRMSVLDAPTIDGGQELHDGYLSYLIQLADISGSGAIAIDDAPDADSIGAIVEQIQFETEQLGDSDLGLAEFRGAELQDLMTQVPACQELLAS